MPLRPLLYCVLCSTLALCSVIVCARPDPASEKNNPSGRKRKDGSMFQGPRTRITILYIVHSTHTIVHTAQGGTFRIVLVVWAAEVLYMHTLLMCTLYCTVDCRPINNNANVHQVNKYPSTSSALAVHISSISPFIILHGPDSSYPAISLSRYPYRPFLAALWRIRAPFTRYGVDAPPRIPSTSSHSCGNSNTPRLFSLSLPPHNLFPFSLSSPPIYDKTIRSSNSNPLAPPFCCINNFLLDSHPLPLFVDLEPTRAYDCAPIHTTPFFDHHNERLRLSHLTLSACCAEPDNVIHSE